MNGIGDLTVGMDLGGMDTYVDNLKVKLLTETNAKIDACEAVITAIDAGWVGVSCDRFKAQFAVARETVKADLVREARDLGARLSELVAFYFKEDQNMIDEI